METKREWRRVGQYMTEIYRGSRHEKLALDGRVKGERDEKTRNTMRRRRKKNEILKR